MTDTGGNTTETDTPDSVNSSANSLGTGTGQNLVSSYDAPTNGPDAGTVTEITQSLSLTFYEGLTESSGTVDLSNAIAQSLTEVTIGIDIFKNGAPSVTDGLFVITAFDELGNELGQVTVSESDLVIDAGGNAYTLTDSTVGGAFSSITIETVTGSGYGDTSIKIDALAITQIVEGEDVPLSFDVDGTDGDGDEISGELSFTLAAATAPVGIDLDGDGTEYLSRDEGVVFTDQSTASRSSSLGGT